MTCLRILPLLAALLLGLGARTAATQAWAAVDVGDGHACALDTDGRAFCWGENHDGQLGARTPESCAPAHHGGDHHTCWAAASDTPVAAANGMRFTALSAGGRRSCGLDGEGRAWCWGREVGTATAGCANGGVCSFDPVELAPELAFRTVRVGADGVCGITPAGEGHCFRPRHGADRRWSATRVAPRHRLTAIEHDGHWMGRDRHLICSVDEAGIAHCQGDNRYAQLGQGDTLPRGETMRVASAERFAEVRARAESACGLTTEGRVICWGWAAPRPSWPGGTPPEPGLFACTYSAWCSAPRPAAAGARFAALTLGHGSYCGLTPSGELHCWGMDGVLHPVAVGVRFAAVAGGEQRSCGVTPEGAAWCWEGDADSAATPVRIPDPPR